MTEITPAPPHSALPAAVRAMRPRQWVKNVLVVAAPAAAGSLFQPAVALNTLGAFVAFCLVSASIYLINDVRDVEADRLHPKKRFRPIAAGEHIVVKHLTRLVSGRITAIRHRWDLGTLQPGPADHIGLNDIARVELDLDQALPVDAGSAWSSAGRFIVIDPATRTTAAAGVIREVLA